MIGIVQIVRTAHVQLHVDSDVQIKEKSCVYSVFTCLHDNYWRLLGRISIQILGLTRFKSNSFPALTDPTYFL